jgi:zinc protease
VVSYTEAKPGEAEALETLAQLLGGDETGVLYRELVVKRRLATNAGADYDGYARDNGTFDIYALPRPGVRLDQLEHAIDQILAAYAKKLPAPADLKRAKTQLVADAMYQRDSQFSLASAYGQALAIGLTTNDVDSWPDRIRAVDADAVRDAVANDLIKREAVTGYLEPGKPK